MDLFNTDTIINLLPADGIVLYYGKVFAQQQAQHYLERLLNTIEWRNDEAVIFGKHIVTKRKVAWYGDKNYDYTYSNTTKQALLWTDELIELKTLTEKLTGATYTLACLIYTTMTTRGWLGIAMVKRCWQKTAP